MVIVLAVVFFGQAALADIKVVSKDPEAVMAGESDGSWSCSQSGTRYVLGKDGAGTVTFKKDSRILAQGTFKGDKLTMNDGTGALYAYLKFDADKIKFSPDNTVNLWEFKIKDEKIKVVYGEADMGKIKYYKDTHKIKAKNNAGNTEAEFKGVSAISLAPAAYLVSSLDSEKKIFLSLLFLSMGK